MSSNCNLVWGWFKMRRHLVSYNQNCIRKMSHISVDVGIKGYTFWIFERIHPQTHFSKTHICFVALCPVQIFPCRFLQDNLIHHTQISLTRLEARLFLSTTLSHIHSQRAPHGLLLSFNIQSPTCKLFSVQTAHCWSHTILISLCVRRESDAMWLVWPWRVNVCWCVSMCFSQYIHREVHSLFGRLVLMSYDLFN